MTKYDYKALLQEVKSRLSIGQAVYFGPNNMSELWPWEITVEKGVIAQIPKEGTDITVAMENGCRKTVDLEISRTRRLYIGSVEGPDGEFSQWATLSEQDLWDYREWDILSTRIGRENFGPQVDYEAVATPLTLSICRIFHDVMKNENVDYQNMSCKKCIHLSNKSPVPSGFCRECIRNGQHKDHWSGGDGDMVPPIGSNN